MEIQFTADNEGSINLTSASLFLSDDRSINIIYVLPPNATGLDTINVSKFVKLIANEKWDVIDWHIIKYKFGRI